MRNTGEHRGCPQLETRPDGDRLRRRELDEVIRDIRIGNFALDDVQSGMIVDADESSSSPTRGKARDSEPDWNEEKGDDDDPQQLRANDPTAASSKKKGAFVDNTSCAEVCCSLFLFRGVDRQVQTMLGQRRARRSHQHVGEATRPS